MRMCFMSYPFSARRRIAATASYGYGYGHGSSSLSEALLRG
jgi:hypothetical protein